MVTRPETELVQIAYGLAMVRVALFDERKNQRFGVCYFDSYTSFPYSHIPRVYVCWSENPPEESEYDEDELSTEEEETAPSDARNSLSWKISTRMTSRENPSRGRLSNTTPKNRIAKRNSAPSNSSSSTRSMRSTVPVVVVPAPPRRTIVSSGGKYFSVPANLSPNRIEDIRHALKELETIQEQLSARIEMLEVVYLASWEHGF
ncbi:hypothetical protein AJ79_01912 [Helicocarpus griseus UAMH5409]|uniref:Uncharacterized protein n=1 Tax=Helicocarpus griseus UAMH5409 TaxID=1447875 RepID=A0A2B7Y4M2_9EURO|nr:hypothetical protein AJ79_01912 [Helicocarpus griseus UAMH5409]